VATITGQGIYSLILFRMETLTKPTENPADGIGQAVATLLEGRGWSIYIADVKEETSLANATNIGATFCKTDIQSYDSIKNTFERTFSTSGYRGTIDFVFANARITDPRNF
jgi:NAD(P)-dependent dehydrogenase (short-subunit alcohol dehydrogenase family)